MCRVSFDPGLAVEFLRHPQPSLFWFAGFVEWPSCRNRALHLHVLVTFPKKTFRRWPATWPLRVEIKERRANLWLDFADGDRSALTKSRTFPRQAEVAMMRSAKGRNAIARSGRETTRKGRLAFVFGTCLELAGGTGDKSSIRGLRCGLRGILR